ncbi:chlorophyllase/cutinase-like alpha/beta fold protein [Alkalicoccus chagannorensis]|uniref:poly(ethylene terephthalate) hydrolase family protein n=1 Tax=Alkalicoccus chagannorensis TaxID=427072 RepID=UPI000415421F|nr:hypothetical protein [Alkalicoccus chagannorensis]
MTDQETEHELPQVKRRPLQQFAAWWQERFIKIPAWDRGLEGVAAAMILAGFAAAWIGALSNPTGLGTFLDVLIYMTANAGISAAFIFTASYLLSLLYIPLPRIILSASAYTALLVFYIQDEAGFGVFFTTVMTGVFIISAYMLGAVFHLAVSRMVLWKRLAAAAIPVFWFILLFAYHPTIAEHNSGHELNEDDYITPLSAEDPGATGPYEVETVYYGSGEDLHRDHFADETDITSTSVNASHLFGEGEWEGWRTEYWGFTDENLPLNGEMWLPETEGPFPVVLITHGNHRMESFSDDGYAYLGEHLASHGYAAVSIDQNFINYSNWTGSPNENMKLRAWLFMQHLLELERYSEDENHPLAGSLDLTSAALIGHSRGGQAAAMVPDYERFFQDDPTLEGMENIDASRVIGLAPTDQEVDDMRPAPENIDYLTLHGARDGDVHNFRGDRQFSRISLEPDSGRLLSSIYIADANHSQFNTSWGRADMSMPGDMFLSREQMMAPEDQQRLTNVLVTAFLETTLRGETAYLPLFEDIRHGEEWLPSSTYVHRFKTSSYSPLVTFNRSNEKETFPEGVTAEGEGFTEWEKASTVDRAGNRKAPDGVLMEWEDEGTYTLQLPENYASSYFEEDVEAFSFTLAQLDHLLPEPAQGDTTPSLELEFTFRDGGSEQVDINSMYEIPEAVWTQFTRYPQLEAEFREGKYENPVEQIYQTMLVPVSLFDDEVDMQNLESISWNWGSGPGRIMMDDIGFERP